MQSSDRDSDCDSGSVRSNASGKRKADTDSNEIFKKPKLSQDEQAEPQSMENVEKTSHGEPKKRWNNKKPHRASGAKNFLHGTIFQLKHLMLTLNRARKKGWAFRLTTEMDDAEKFDDLVFEYEDKPGSRVHRFMQMKHKLDDTKKISERDLLAEDDSDFSILKYFISWRRIKKNSVFAESNSKCFYICTNIGLDRDKIDQSSMSFTEVNERDEFLEITTQKKQPPRYKIQRNEKSKLYETLKSASDLHQLAKALAHCVSNSKKLELKADILKRYHVALAQEIVHIENKKARFSDNFIKDNCLSDATKKFRDIFVNYYVKQLSAKKGLPPIHKIWQNLASKTFTRSPKFGETSETKPQDTLPSDEITDEEISNFLDEFILAVGQPNEHGLDEMIQNEFSNDSWLNLQNVSFPVDSFHNKILDWFKSKQGVPLVNEDADKFFAELQREVDILMSAGVSLGYTAKLDKYDVRFKSEIRDVVNFLKDSKSIKKPKLHLISSRKIVLTALRIWQTVKRSQKYKKRDTHIFIDLKKLLLPDIKKGIFAALESSKSPTLLIVDCESNNTQTDSPELSREVWNQLCKIIEDKADKKMIIMTHADDLSVRNLNTKYETTNETDSDIAIDKLETSTQQRLLNKKVLRIQGRGTKMSYARLLGTDILNNVDSKELTDCRQMISLTTLVKLIKDEDIEMGDKITGWDDIEECYISRKIDRHVIIKADVLRDPEIDDIIAIGGIDEEGLASLLATQESSQSSQSQHFHPEDYTILKKIGQEKNDFQELCRKNSNRNLHWLQHVSDKLILKQSFGSIANLIKYKEKSEDHRNTDKQGAIHLTEDQLAEAARDEQDKIVILSDTAGMGKSTMLSRLAKVLRDKEILVMRVDLTQNTIAFASELEKRTFDCSDTEKAVDFLIAKLSNLHANQDSETSATHKRMIKMRGEAALLFDGFDEISPHYTETVIELLQALAKLQVTRLLVTTRREMSEELEEKLGVFSHTMQPFSPTDQVNFLTKFWRKELNNNESVARPPINENDLLNHAKGVLKLLNKSIDPSMQEFTGIPLHTRMVAEVFPYGGSKLPKKIKIIDLYDQFVEKKFDIFSEEKKRCDQTNPAVKDSEKFTRHALKDIHKKWALVALFDEETVEILLNSQPDVSKSDESFAKDIQARLRPGIVDKFIADKPHFVHRTFAEYFAALFLFDTLKNDLRDQKVRKIFVEQLFTNSQYPTIRAFLNSLLADEKYDRKSPIDFWKFDLIEHRNVKGETAYHVAARERNIEIARFLVNKLRENHQVQFSNINCPSDEGKTPLIVAVETTDNTAVVKYFVKAGANIESQTNEGETPLHLAISIPYRLKIANYLIDQEANIEAETKGGLTPLHLAAQSGRLPIMKKLSKKGANTNAKTNDGFTLLHSAARYNKVNVVDHLVKEGANIDSQSEDGKTALHLAAEYGKLNVVEYLVRKEASLNSRDKEGKTPLHLAAEYGKLSVVKHLVEKKADLDSRDNDGKTPLHLAIKDGKSPVAEHLVKGGVNVDAQDKDGSTPLHLATECCNKSLVKFLLQNGADVEYKNVNGWTPLHVAIGMGKKNIMGDLIEAGANLESKTAGGRTAWEMMNIRFKKKDIRKYSSK